MQQTTQVVRKYGHTMKLITETRTASATESQYVQFVESDEVAEKAYDNALLTFDETDGRIVFHAGAEGRLVSRFADFCNGGRNRGNGTGTRRTKIVARVKATVTRQVVVVDQFVSTINNALSEMATMPVDTPVFAGFMHIAETAICDAVNTAPEAATAEYDSTEADIKAYGVALAALKLAIAEKAIAGDDFAEEASNATQITTELATLAERLEEIKEQTEPVA